MEPSNGRRRTPPFIIETFDKIYVVVVNCKSGRRVGSLSSNECPAVSSWSISRLSAAIYQFLSVSIQFPFSCLCFFWPSSTKDQNSCSHNSGIDLDRFGQYWSDLQ